MARSEYRIVLVRGIGLDRDIEDTIFQRSGFDVRMVDDVEQLPATIEASRPNLLIAGLGEGEGPRACRQLKEHPEWKKTRVLIVVEQGDDDTRQRCQLAGADATFVRSQGLQPFMKTVAGLLGISTRKPVRMTVLFSVANADAVGERIGRAMNLSETGIGLQVNRQYDIAESLKLRFMLPGSRGTIQAAGQVRWIDHGGPDVYSMGVEFTEVAPTEHALLLRYLAN